jgi:hypothetical protein
MIVQEIFSAGLKRSQWCRYVKEARKSSWPFRTLLTITSPSPAPKVIQSHCSALIHKRDSHGSISGRGSSDLKAPSGISRPSTTYQERSLVLREQALNRNLPSNLNDLITRQPEEIADVRRIALHHSEKGFLLRRHGWWSISTTTQLSKALMCSRTTPANPSALCARSGVGVSSFMSRMPVTSPFR